MPIGFSIRAEKIFSTLEKAVKERIGKKLIEIENNPSRYVQNLTGLPLEKIRIGDYRLFVELDLGNNSIFIADIKHRKNAYK
ncbi:MAG: type II toxin-antitoxin system RelE/ParE family toxin [Candidatus Micrarchaeota archaeon]